MSAERYCTPADLRAAGIEPDLRLNPDGTVQLIPGLEEIRQRIIARWERRPPLWATGLASWLRLHSSAISMTGKQIDLMDAEELIGVCVQIRDKLRSTARA